MDHHVVGDNKVRDGIHRGFHVFLIFLESVQCLWWCEPYLGGWVLLQDFRRHSFRNNIADLNDTSIKRFICVLTSSSANFCDLGKVMPAVDTFSLEQVHRLRHLSLNGHRGVQKVFSPQLLTQFATLSLESKDFFIKFVVSCQNSGQFVRTAFQLSLKFGFSQVCATC
jgi:hypothetical protein